MKWSLKLEARRSSKNATWHDTAQKITSSSAPVNATKEAKCSYAAHHPLSCEHRSTKKSDRVNRWTQHLSDKRSYHRSYSRPGREPPLRWLFRGRGFCVACQLSSVRADEGYYRWGSSCTVILRSSRQGVHRPPQKKGMKRPLKYTRM